MGRFATWCSTQIQDTLARLRVEYRSSNPRGCLLYIEQTEPVFYCERHGTRTLLHLIEIWKSSFLAQSKPLLRQTVDEFLWSDTAPADSEDGRLRVCSRFPECVPVRDDMSIPS
jgi:hypothetical protein